MATIRSGSYRKYWIFHLSMLIKTPISLLAEDRVCSRLYVLSIIAGHLHTLNPWEQGVTYTTSSSTFPAVKWQAEKRRSTPWTVFLSYIDGLEQDCSNSSVLAMKSLQSCAKPSIWSPWLQILSGCISILWDKKKISRGVSYMFVCSLHTLDVSHVK